MPALGQALGLGLPYLANKNTKTTNTFFQYKPALCNCFILKVYLLFNWNSNLNSNCPIFYLTVFPWATMVSKTNRFGLQRAPFLVEGTASKPVGSWTSSLKVGMSNMKKINQLWWQERLLFQTSGCWHGANQARGGQVQAEEEAARAKAKALRWEHVWSVLKFQGQGGQYQGGKGRPESSHVESVGERKAMDFILRVRGSH